jgi:hypothetical protein
MEVVIVLTYMQARGSTANEVPVAVLYNTYQQTVLNHWKFRRKKCREIHTKAEMQYIECKLMDEAQ